MSFDLADYKDVPSRIADFRAKHPEGSLRPADPAIPYRIETIEGRTYIVYVAAAYRTPDDPCPGIGVAYEPFPGRTPYTKDSELQNAETSAWGRAILASLASESKHIASADDVRNRRAEQETVEPLGDGWATYADRDDAWDWLRDATAALPEDAAAEVRAEVKALGFTKHTFSTVHAQRWTELLAQASGAADVRTVLPSGDAPLTGSPASAAPEEPKDSHAKGVTR